MKYVVFFIMLIIYGFSCALCIRHIKKNKNVLFVDKFDYFRDIKIFKLFFSKFIAIGLITLIVLFILSIFILNNLTISGFKAELGFYIFLFYFFLTNISITGIFFKLKTKIPNFNFYSYFFTGIYLLTVMIPASLTILYFSVIGLIYFN